MTDTRAVATKVSRAIWMGLFLSLFSMVVVRYVVVFSVYEITFGWAILKETIIWATTWPTYCRASADNGTRDNT